MGRVKEGYDVVKSVLNVINESVFKDIENIMKSYVSLKTKEIIKTAIANGTREFTMDSKSIDAGFIVRAKIARSNNYAINTYMLDQGAIMLFKEKPELLN